MAAEGLLKEARELDKLIRASAKEGNRRWAIEGLQGQCWDPIRALTKGQPPRVVTLKRRGQGDDDAGDGGTAAQVYAYHLGQAQWGRGEQPSVEEAGWGASPLSHGEYQGNTG